MSERDIVPICGSVMDGASNYNLWRHRIKHILVNKGLWDCVPSGEPICKLFLSMDSPDMTRISAQIVIGAAITPTRAPSTTLASSIQCQDLSPTVIWSTQIKRNFQIQRKNLEMLDII
jgi:hypothetical protein